MRRIDLSGAVFGRLAVLGYARSEVRDGGTRQRTYAYWNCICLCGNSKEIRADDLLRGRTQSCGCFHKTHLGDSTRKHGLTDSPEYKIWTDMWSRCTNPNRGCYQNYGGRGIHICERWKSFENFLQDMGNRPSLDHSVDREKNSLGYSPENCRWAIRIEQANNRRTNVKLSFNGETLTISQWAERSGIGKVALYQRSRAGWDTQRMLTEPVGASKGRVAV